MKIIVTLVLFIFLLAGCTNFQENQSKPVRFAIIGDLTGGEREGVFNVGAYGLTAMQPDFILSIGDLIEGGIEDVDTLNKEWSSFTDRLDNQSIPFYPLVGNHDISNVIQRQWYEETVAPRYYHVRHRDLLFLMLDSEDFTDKRFADFKVLRNEAIEIYKKDKKAFFNTEYANLPERKYGLVRKEQSEYFLDVLQKNSDVRWVFVLMHKPLWRSDDSGFSEIEIALSGFSYTVFNGHEHAYHHTERNGRDYIQLGTTGGEYTPKDRGEYMDHIMWVSVTDSGPKYLNITLDGMRDKFGKVPAGGDELCLSYKACKEDAL